MSRALSFIALFLISHCSAAKLRILHYNDNHGRIESQDSSFNVCANLSQCYGGFAKQQTIISNERKNANNIFESMKKDILLIHAGDQFTGTLWDSVYTSQGNFSAVIPFLNAQGIDAFTFGNHEFDYGPALLASFLKSTPLPVTSCNIDFSKEPAFNGMNIPRYIIKTLPVSGIKVGFIGFTTLETPETSSPGKNIAFADPTTVAAKCIADAKSAGASLVVAVSHLGYSVDKLFAAHPSSAGINLIVGGHSHSFLYNGNPPVLLLPNTTDTYGVEGYYPTTVNNIPIVQAMWGSRYMGALDIDTNGVAFQSIVGQPILLGDSASSNNVADDPSTAASINLLKSPLNALLTSVAGTSAVDLDGERANVRNKETNLGNMVADSQVWYVNNRSTLLGQSKYANLPIVSLFNGGGIRASAKAGTITRGQIVTILPFGNMLQAKLIDASTLTSALNNGVSQWTGDSNAAGRFPQVGGVRFTFNSSAPAASRVMKIYIKNGSADISLDKYSGSIILLTNDFVAKGGDGYTAVASAPLLLDTSTAADFVLSEYVKSNSPVAPKLEGRIVDCGTDPTNAACGAAAPAPAPLPMPSPPKPSSPPSSSPPPSPPPPPPPPCSSTMEGYFVPYALNSGTPVIAKDWKDCCSKCQSSSACAAYTFSSTSTKCYFKSEATFVKGSSKFYSGAKM